MKKLEIKDEKCTVIARVEGETFYFILRDRLNLTAFTIFFKNKYKCLDDGENNSIIVVVDGVPIFANSNVIKKSRIVDFSDLKSLREVL